MADSRTGRKGIDKSKTNMAAKFLRKEGYETIEPMAFYREVFPAGELASWRSAPKSANNDLWEYTGIVIEKTDKEITYPSKIDPTRAITKKAAKRHIICDDLKAIEQVIAGGNFCFMSPISYVGKARKTANARFLYALVIEIDNLVPRNEGIKELLYAFSDKKADGSSKMRLCVPPSYIVCSGTGVHLYWLLQEPMPLYEDDAFLWGELKREWTTLLWNKYITRSWHSLDVQYEPLFQGFRVVGSKGKNGSLVEAFRITGKRYTADELFNQYGTQAEKIEVCPRDCIPSVSKRFIDLRKNTDKPYSARMMECKELYPEWFKERIIDGVPPKPKGTWRCKRDLYDWWLNRIEYEATVGHRYFCLHTLAIYAIKCGISYEELATDCFDLVKRFDVLGYDTNNHFTEEDAMAALLAYEDEKSYTHTREYVSNKTGIPIVPQIKRNGLKQNIHLQLARDRKASLKKVGFLRYDGRPTAERQVAEWQKKHPTGRKADCIKDTGLSKPTVYKWWKG